MITTIYSQARWRKAAKGGRASPSSKSIDEYFLKEQATREESCIFEDLLGNFTNPHALSISDIAKCLSLSYYCLFYRMSSIGRDERVTYGYPWRDCGDFGSYYMDEGYYKGPCRSFNGLRYGKSVGIGDGVPCLKGPVSTLLPIVQCNLESFLISTLILYCDFNVSYWLSKVGILLWAECPSSNGWLLCLNSILDL